MDTNKVYITIASVVAILVFVIGAYYATNQPKPVVTNEQMKVVAKDDHVKWSPSKKHVLVEYSDLQCPACQGFHTFMKSAIDTDKKITGNITFVYRHFPLIMAHPFANDAAYAAEAAAMQGKFFEMTDLMFENQAKWAEDQNPQSIFRAYAEKLKLDLEKYDVDVASDAVKQRVAKDVKSGNAAQVDSTPTFYLDGVKVEVASYEEFKELLLDTAEKPAPSPMPTVAAK